MHQRREPRRESYSYPESGSFYLNQPSTRLAERSVSPPLYLQKSRSPPLTLRERDRSPYYSDRSSRSPQRPQTRSKSRSPDYFRRRSKSPPHTWRKSESPDYSGQRGGSPQTWRRSRSPAYSDRRSRSPQIWRKSKSPTNRYRGRDASPDYWERRESSPDYRERRESSPYDRERRESLSLYSAKRLEAPIQSFVRNSENLPRLLEENYYAQNYSRINKIPSLFGESDKLQNYSRINKIPSLFGESDNLQNYSRISESEQHYPRVDAPSLFSLKREQPSKLYSKHSEAITSYPQRNNSTVSSVPRLSGFLTPALQGSNSNPPDIRSLQFDFLPVRVPQRTDNFNSLRDKAEKGVTSYNKMVIPRPPPKGPPREQGKLNGAGQKRLRYLLSHGMDNKEPVKRAFKPINPPRSVTKPINPSTSFTQPINPSTSFTRGKEKLKPYQGIALRRSKYPVKGIILPFSKPQNSQRLVTSVRNLKAGGIRVGKIQERDVEQNLKLGGAARKRLRYFLSQGVAREAALEMARKPWNAKRPFDKGTEKLQFNKKSFQGIPRQTSSSPAKADIIPFSSRRNSQLNISQEARGIKVAIIHCDFPKQLLTKVQLAGIQESIMDMIMELDKEVDIKPNFLDLQHKDGWLSFSCANKATVEWLKSIASDLRQSTGIAVKVIKETEMPRHDILITHLRDSQNYSSEKILALLGAQNESDLSSWRVLSKEMLGAVAKVTFSMDEKAVEELTKEGYKMNYKFGIIKFMLKQKVSGGADSLGIKAKTT